MQSWLLRVVLPVLLVAALVGLVLRGARPGAAPLPEHPNVIVLVMDTTRGDRTTIVGGERATTPYLSRLAAESTVYLDAWSPACWTGPAHASLFTGLRPEHHGFTRDARFFLEEPADTLAEILSRAGYDTACLTSNPLVNESFGLTQGFRVVETVPETPDEPATQARNTTARALAFVRTCRAASRPFFLFVNQWMPHLPYTPPPGVADRFLPPGTNAGEVAAARRFEAVGPDLFTRPWRRFSPRRWSVLSALYDAEIAALDGEIALFVTSLAEEGGIDDTVLVITSDHGENLGDHGLAGHYASLHRTLLHVPLLIRFPPAVRRGQRIREVVRLEDVFPTVLALCRLPIPEGLDAKTLTEAPRGRVARAVLGADRNSNLPRDFPEFHRSGLWQAVRSAYDGRFHLLRRPDGLEELYDVKEDPLERANLLPGNEGEAARLRALLPKGTSKDPAPGPATVPR